MSRLIISSSRAHQTAYPRASPSLALYWAPAYLGLGSTHNNKAVFTLPWVVLVPRITPSHESHGPRKKKQKEQNDAAL